MILQGLVRYYEDLLRLGKIARPGWGPAKVSFALELGKGGELLSLIILKTEQQRGKKSGLFPRSMEVPMPAKRASGIAANFLCDNSGYLLGVDTKGKPERTEKCFTAARELHLSLLSKVNTPAAQAVVAYFQNWDPDQAFNHPALTEDWKEIQDGANLIFWYEDKPVTEDPEIRRAWQRYYDQPGTGPVMPCLVTGAAEPAALIHPAIKGVKDAQTAGAALISFNAPAFCSYDREQNANAPLSGYAAFAYTSALNYLLADREHVRIIGNTTVVCWVEGGEEGYTDAALALLYGDSPKMTNASLRAIVEKLARGEKADWAGTPLEPERRFYILGLSPNAARLSVRFFLENSFGNFLKNVDQHYKDLEIIRPAFDKIEQLPLWKLLSETVNQKSTDKTSNPQMSGDVLRSILVGGQYPATLLNSVMLRIRAEHQVTRGRAAILKAYYLRNKHQDCPKEVLTVELNEASMNIPYTLGRMFSVLEAVQQAANPEINTTIKDKYFNSAAATPATIFPLLVNLAQKHFRKLKEGQRIYYEKQLAPLMDFVGRAYPRRLTLPEQGSFHLGYYHQTQKRYEKKEEKVND